MACSDDDPEPSGPEETNPKVSSSSTYQVLLEENVVYGYGLHHESLNSAAFSMEPLALDVYYPDNDIEKRPVIMFIHGGAFIGGSKSQGHIISLANYFASRGWVFVSIDYRLRDDIGSVPQEWVDFSQLTPIEDVSKFLAIYPAHRDAKAAMRWLVSNASTFNIDTNYISVGGGSAGAVTAITLGISHEEDYRDELSIVQDPSLETTHLSQTYQIKTILNFWGTKVGLDALSEIYNKQRFDEDNPPLFIAHGTLDDIVPFSHAEDLKSIYENLKLPLAYYPLEGFGHSAWNATYNGQSLEELAFDFIVEQQNLIVE
ncbi:MAG: hypothetical protein BM564_11650 [Bacteroidetes bacterium MedPE-SWsnd-G2]|nr:MAG: hypothetical protein BM564_11650 [Bacteroidetes bacterium MedPE-SWsnd-G2]